MSERAFYAQESKARVAAAIREVEAQTSAELVVTVRHQSGNYRDIHYLVGFAFALGTLALLLFLPDAFALWSMPVDLVFGFLVGVFITSHAPPLCRFLLSDARAEREARARACSAFLDRGMSRKKGRTGILVFVSTFERVVVWLPDIGIDTEALGEDFRAQEKAAERAVARHDFDAFVEALRALGPPLGRALPHHADDLNELPDEVVES